MWMQGALEECDYGTFLGFETMGHTKPLKRNGLFCLSGLMNTAHREVTHKMFECLGYMLSSSFLIQQ